MFQMKTFNEVRGSSPAPHCGTRQLLRSVNVFKYTYLFHNRAGYRRGSAAVYFQG